MQGLREGMKSMGLLGLIGGLLLLIAACGGNEDATFTLPLVTSTPTAAAPSTPASEGERLFTINGCGACHGSEGEGSAIAPGLAGHTASQVKRQARASPCPSIIG